MTNFEKFIYRLGGYDYKIIEKINTVTTHFGMKYFIPGFSLLIVFLTAGYGGWHFTATLIDKQGQNFELIHLLGTLFFATFIFMIDYLILNAGTNRLILYARVILSFGLGSIVAILTTLAFFSADIIAENEHQKNLSITPINNLYDSKIAVIDSEQIKLDNRLTGLRDTAIAERQGRTKSGVAGAGPIWEEIHTNIILDSLKLIEYKATQQKKKELIEKDRKRELDKVEREFASDDFIAQINSLWRLMKEKIVSIYASIFLVSLIICDLIPLLAKIGKDYSNDYDPYKEYLSQIQDKLKFDVEEITIDITDIRQIKARNDAILSRFNEDTLIDINTLYALEKYNDLLKYFKDKKLPEATIQRMLNDLHKRMNNKKNEG
jgi:hypothetical protein